MMAKISGAKFSLSEVMTVDPEMNNGCLFIIVLLTKKKIFCLNILGRFGNGICVSLF